MKYDYEININSNSSAAIILRNVSPNSTVLEFGPATGYMTRYMKEQLGCSVVCVEVDQEAARRAADFCTQMIVADIEKFEWTDQIVGKTFDYIIFADVLEHLRDPLTVLKTAVNYLAEEGSVLISLPNVGHNAVIMELIQGRFQYRPLGLLDESHIRFFTRASVLQMLKAAGLALVKFSTTKLLPEHTEFKQSYDNFALENRNLLLDREDGHVYQFVTMSQKGKDIELENIENELKSKETENNYLKIYWEHNGRLDEENSAKLPLDNQSNDCGEVTVVLPVKELDTLRIDPINHPAKVDIKAILVYEVDKNGQENLCFECSDHNNFQNLSLGEGAIRLGQNKFDLICFTNNPQIYLKNIGVSLSANTIRLKIILNTELISYKDITQSLADVINGQKQNIIDLHIEKHQITKKFLVEHKRIIENRNKIVEEKNQIINSKRWKLINRIIDALHRPKAFLGRVKRFLNRGFSKLRSVKQDYVFNVKSHHVREALRKKLRELPATVETVDIIIPIYNAYEMVVECVQSVLRNTSVPFRLILINDCSTDSRVEEFLGTLQGSENREIMVLNNPENLGFVGTVNRGLQLSNGHVVLLNSDTELPTGWLERLCALVDEDAVIGTVTPFSNNATICSFPNFCQDNQLPEGFDAESLDKVFKEYAPKIIVDIPTAVGFCMFISRPCLDMVGILDEETFGRGYGEENDFCMRAEALGFRNVLCPNLFVYHKGRASFGLEQNSLAEENSRRLSEKHPTYDMKVSQFVTADPILPIRKAVLSSLALVQGQRLGVLYILHGLGGGTEIHVEDLIKNNKEIRPYVLKPCGENIEFIDRTGISPVAYTFPINQLTGSQWFRDLCAAFQISAVHIQHLISYSDELKTAIIHSGIPYFVTLHDFFSVCPKINLLRKGTYCHAEKNTDNCGQCLEDSGINIEEWRRRWGTLLNKAVKVITPSSSTADIVKGYFPNVEFTVIPHGNEPFVINSNNADKGKVQERKALRICLLGVIAEHKGSGLLEQLITVTRQRNLPFKWIVIGYTTERPEPYRSNDLILTVHGKYQREEIPVLLQSYKADLVFIPSICPETYSYTLSEAWLAGYPVLAADLGALGERIGENGGGWLIPDLKVDTIVNFLIKLAQNFDEVEHKSNDLKKIALPSIDTMVKQYNQLYFEYNSQHGTLGNDGKPKDLLDKNFAKYK